MKDEILETMIGKRVVLDTTSSMIYIGTLQQYSERGYWLGDADVHDRSDGHSSKEAYISEAAHLESSGAHRSNRRRVFVERHAVVSLSALSEIVEESFDDDDAEQPERSREP